MKILFATPDRPAAQLGAQTLHGIAPNGTFTWAQTPNSALRWLGANRDAAMAIVEADREDPDGAQFLEQARQLGIATRIVAVPPGCLGTWLTSRKAHDGSPTVAAAEPADRASNVRTEKLTIALQHRLLELERAIEESRRTHDREKRAAAEHLARRETQLGAALSRANAALAGAERKVTEAIAAAEQVRQRAADESATADMREAGLENRLARETKARGILEQRLATAEAVRADAERRHAVDLADALARLGDLQTRYDAVLQEHADVRVDLEQQFADAEAARQTLASKAAVASARLATLEDRLVRETAARQALEHNLAAADAARTDSDRRHSTELAHAAARLVELQSGHDAAVTEHAAALAALDRQLADVAAVRAELVSEAAVAATRLAILEESLAAADASRADAERRYAIDAAEAAARLAELQKSYDAALAEHAATRSALDRQLADAAAATEKLIAREAAAAVYRAALEDRLAQEMAARAALEQNLAATEAARADAEHRHATELADAVARLADLQTRYDVLLTDHAAARAMFEQQLADAAAAKARLISEADAAAARQSILEERLAREAASREGVERDLAAAEAARADSDRRHAVQLEEAAGRLADVQYAYEAALADHVAARSGFEQRLACTAADLEAAEHMRRTLERDLAENRADALRARRRLMGLTIALRRRGRDQRTELKRQLDRQRADGEREIAEKQQEICAAGEQLVRLQAERDADRQDYERSRLASEVEVGALKSEHAEARRALDHLGLSFATLERLAADNARERARLESALAERDAHARAQVERYAAAERVTTEAIATLRHDLETARTDAARLQPDAARAPILQRQLEESQREARRVFERAPYGLCRFMADASFIKANHSFARLVGYKKVEDIRNVGVEAIFECPPDLRWVIEQAVGTVATHTIATTLKTKNGRRVDARLHALSHVDGTVDVAVQDITSVRALEARLREAQRMEAVGRLASEVAVTCDMVLRDASHDGRQWLAAIDSDPELRRRGELLLGEVTRAAGFLRQFSVYGRKQMSAVGPVSVQRIVRDLAPVLKRVAGDDIEWILPRMSRPVEVDVDPELVERVLVNVASYARERMRHGGRIRIEVATTVLGRDVISRYPNVRSGAHALITIAEVKEDADRTDVVASGSDKTGVDLGALLALLGNCGGHLWIAAERSGNMTLKVHLPKRVSDRADGPDPAAARTPRTRELAGWFRH